MTGRWLYAFDLLELDGQVLARLLVRARVGLEVNDHLAAPGDVVFRHACQLGLEGIVSKLLGSRYTSGRSRDWLKFKNPAAPAVRREACCPQFGLLGAPPQGQGPIAWAQSSVWLRRALPDHSFPVLKLLGYWISPTDLFEDLGGCYPAFACTWVCWRPSGRFAETRVAYTQRPRQGC
jgi:hypothetical protein